MNMAINVYEDGRGRKCVCMFRYTYAGIRILNMQIGEVTDIGTGLCVHQQHRDKVIY